MTIITILMLGLSAHAAMTSPTDGVISLPAAAGARKPAHSYDVHMINDLDSDREVQHHCKQWAQEAKTGKLVIMYEGLTVYSADFVEQAYQYQQCLRENPANCRPLSRAKKSASFVREGYITRNVLSPLLKECGYRFEFIVLGHDKEDTGQRNDPKTYGLVCAKEFLRVYPKTQILVAGHSIGGPAAAILAEKLERTSPNINFSTILVDSVMRIPPLTTIGGMLLRLDRDKLEGSTVTPGKTFRHFYETNDSGFFPITEFVPRSNRAKMIPVLGSGVNHISILDQPPVQDAFAEFCD